MNRSLQILVDLGVASSSLPLFRPSLAVRVIHLGDVVIDVSAYPDGRIEERWH